jgi:hypothetical protein
VAGAFRYVDVVAFGVMIVGLPPSTRFGVGGSADLRRPVRIADGRICSNPWLAATASMDLKYWKIVRD